MEKRAQQVQKQSLLICFSLVKLNHLGFDGFRECGVIALYFSGATNQAWKKQGQRRNVNSWHMV